MLGPHELDISQSLMTIIGLRQYNPFIQSKEIAMIRPQGERICLQATSALVLAAAFWIAPQSSAQGATQVEAAALPQDPKALLLLAAKLNGLSGDDVQPWHMKISFSVFDENGKKTDQGTFEAYWVDKSKFKLSYSTAAFTQSAYGTKSGVLFTGARDPAPELLRQMVNKFISPISLDAETIGNSKVDKQKREIEKAKVVCLIERVHRPEPPHAEFMGPSYCLDTDSVALRSVGAPFSGNLEDFRNNIIQFQGHFLPGDLETRRGSKPVVKAHIELVELLIANNEAALAPPKDAQPPPQMVTVSENDARNLLVQSLKPVYPPIAKAAMVSGPVVLQVNIGTDGHFIAARVLSGPPMLQQAAVEAVKKCSFKPMVQNGEAVQMTTTITIPFKLP